MLAGGGASLENTGIVLGILYYGHCQLNRKRCRQRQFMCLQVEDMCDSGFDQHLSFLSNDKRRGRGLGEDAGNMERDE